VKDVDSVVALSVERQTCNQEQGRRNCGAALVVRGCTGEEKCLFCKTIHNCICIKTVWYTNDE